MRKVDLPGDEIVDASMTGWIHQLIEQFEFFGFVEFIVFIELNHVQSAFRNPKPFRSAPRIPVTRNS